MKLVRVTEPLSIFFRDATAGVDPALIEHASARGTEVHAAIAAYELGFFPPTLPEEIQGYFDSFRTWFDKYVDHVFFVEEELVDEELGIVGHPDVGLRMRHGRNLIIDYKTPASDSKTWGPQVAAYRHLAEKNRPEKYVGCMALQPKKDGGTARAYTYQRSGEMFQIYLSALNCYRYFSA